MSNIALIVECLRVYREHVVQREEAPGAIFKVISFEEIVMNVSAADRVTELLRDPIRSSLRGRVREEGWRAFAVGGMPEMERVASEVENAVTEAPGFAGSTLDKWWDGIGTMKGKAGWCS